VGALLDGSWAIVYWWCANLWWHDVGKYSLVVDILELLQYRGGINQVECNEESERGEIYEIDDAPGSHQ
jgi:hypothetical protein